MIRPRLFAVDVPRHEMTLVFPPSQGQPPRWITVHMRTTVQSPRVARTAALAEIQSLQPRDVELLYESARIGPITLADDTDLEQAIAVDHRAHHIELAAVHCPACGVEIDLGPTATSLFVRRCADCRGMVSIEFTADGVRVDYVPPTT
jgi:hypothetical protein